MGFLDLNVWLQLITRLILCSYSSSPLNVWVNNYQINTLFLFLIFLNVWVNNYQIDTLHMVPPVAARIVKSPLVNQFDLSHLKNVITASAPLASAIEQKLKELVPNRKLHVIQGTIILGFLRYLILTYKFISHLEIVLLFQLS